MQRLTVSISLSGVWQLSSRQPSLHRVINAFPPPPSPLGPLCPAHSPAHCLPCYLPAQLLHLRLSPATGIKPPPSTSSSLQNLICWPVLSKKLSWEVSFACFSVLCTPSPKEVSHAHLGMFLPVGFSWHLGAAETLSEHIRRCNSHLQPPPLTGLSQGCWCLQPQLPPGFVKRGFLWGQRAPLWHFPCSWLPPSCTA